MDTILGIEGATRRRAALAQLPELARRIGEDAAAREARRELPHFAFVLFRDSGLGALRIPAEQGGLGGSLEDVFDVIATLAAEESNVAHALRLHFDVTETLLLGPRNAHAELQVQRVLEGAIYGGAATELGTARPGQIETTLTRHGDHYRVTGRKYYATGTAFSDYARVNLRDEEDRSVVAFIPVARQGVRVLDDWDGMGQRMTASGTLELDDVRVEPHEVLPRESGNLLGRHTGALRQLHLVAVAAGIVRRVFRDARDYVLAHGRPVQHSPAATAREDGFVQHVVGELAAQSLAIDTLVRENARTLDRSANAIAADAPDAEALVLDSALVTAKTQLIVSQLALRAGERLFDAGGASMTAARHNFDRHWRNLRTVASHNPLSHKTRVLGDYHLNGTTVHLEEGKVF
ncbi:acyl-CoA dehydrogenase family protein [Bordetella genomosp. 13]|uniref:acyl-CoA dehydrogenase family protein n=1 Tax=Bordetella genomosp. 13 TaxID=463040 RepID=UPI00119E8FA4|nr:acyl-CoA dehydrogenase family protein [Bordetella genomosp. 13]